MNDLIWIPASWVHQKKYNAVNVQSLDKNEGIAIAHNLGIQWAREHHAKFVLLMDQDSIVAPDMVKQLLVVIRQKIAANLPVAAVGPRYMDKRQNNPPPFISVKGLTLKRHACTTKNSTVAVDYLISSGCLVPMSVFDIVGSMRDDLFIDYVDIEWGLRAQHFGFQSFGVCAAHMQHDLGEQPVKFLGKNIPVHTPLRHYYHFRNAVALYKESWVPLNWKLVDGRRLVLKYLFYSLFTKPRLAHFHMMSKGLWHAFTSNMGKLNID